MSMSARQLIRQILFGLFFLPCNYGDVNLILFVAYFISKCYCILLFLEMKLVNSEITFLFVSKWYFEIYQSIYAN